MTIPLRLLLPTGSSCQPEPSGPKRPRGITPREVPIWHCSRWGLPCRSCCQSRGGLLPHRFTLTCAGTGGLFSVALSLGFPQPGVTRHRCFVESGLSSRCCHHAAIQPSAHMAYLGIHWGGVNGETQGQIQCNFPVGFIQRSRGPWAKPQPKRRQQAFLVCIGCHTKLF